MTSFEKEYGLSPKKKIRRRVLTVLLLLGAFIGGFVVVASNGDLSHLSESVAGRLTAGRQAPADENGPVASSGGGETSRGEAGDLTSADETGEPARIGETGDLTGDSTPQNDSEPAVDAKPDVEPGDGPLTEPTVEELQSRIADLEAQILIDHAIRAAPRLAGADIWVTVEGSSVALTGSVVATNQVEAAETIARAAVQHAVITTSLTIADSAEAPMDPEAALRRRVEYELHATDAFHLPGIRVTARGGVVTLSGTVRAKAERLLARRIAEDVPGVAEVRNELEVNPSTVAIKDGPGPTADRPTTWPRPSR